MADTFPCKNGVYAGMILGGFKYFFTPTWARFPVWLVFFKWVGSTTNQTSMEIFEMICHVCLSTIGTNLASARHPKVVWRRRHCCHTWSTFWHFWHVTWHAQYGPSIKMDFCAQLHFFDLLTWFFFAEMERVWSFWGIFFLVQLHL